MSEFRQNLATKQWIIIAAERAKRPHEWAHTRLPAGELPAYASDCPFCPGQEHHTPEPILSIAAEESGEPWCVRVVPNKYPALAPVPSESCFICSEYDGPYLHRRGVGHHEVIIETPLHNRDVPLLPPTHIEHIMEAYCRRYNALIQDPAVDLVVIFRNHGEKAGTSLIHPHSQIVASSVVPFLVRNKLYEGQRYFDNFGRCVYCDMLHYERQTGLRVISENEHFLAVAPYASSVPYEIWLLPKHHRPSFGTVEADEIRDLAHVLQNLLARLWRLLDDPDYNYVIDTAPEHMADVPFYHWHLEIYPRLTTQAGFEIGSGIGINVVAPEDAAAQLRETNGAPLTMDEVQERRNGAS